MMGANIERATDYAFAPWCRSAAHSMKHNGYHPRCLMSMWCWTVAVVVVKRSTDPVRINNSSFSVAMSGLASGAYRLVADRTKFHANNDTRLAASLPVGGSGEIEIYGDIPSSAMSDATLSLETVEGTTLCTTNITVLWVDISMRCGQDDDFSQDNDFTAPIGTNMLGRQSYRDIVYVQDGIINAIAGGFVNVVEFKGAVHPQDFPFSVSFTRDNTDSLIGYRLPSSQTDVIDRQVNIPRGSEPSGNDPPPPEFQDSSLSPYGNIYDVDTPGVRLHGGARNPIGTIIWTRQNFLQYCAFGNRRCSNDYPWFSRTIVRKTTPPGSLWHDFYFSDEFPDGNSVGEGSCNVNR